LTPTGSGERARNLNIANALETAGTCLFVADVDGSVVILNLDFADFHCLYTMEKAY
jgi:hypothetical protein